MSITAQDYLHIPILQKRSTDLKSRVIHLIKNAYLIPISYKLKLTTLTKEYFKHEFLKTPTNSLNLLLFWEILKHLQRKHRKIYSGIVVKTLSPQLIKLHKQLIYTPQDIFPLPSTNTNKTTLYTFNTNTLKQVELPLILSSMSIHIAQTLALYYHLKPTPNILPLYFVDNFLIYKLYWQYKLDPGIQKIEILLPPHYFRPLKHFLINKETMLALSKFINSKKRAKKYIRILHKRLGIYAKRKPPWRT